MTFTELKINQEIIEKLAQNGITEPTAVQQKVIPLVNQGKNLMFQSETGTGKTFSYLLPLIQKLSEENKAEEQKKNSKDVKILIASPTYELASQIKVQVQKISDIKCALCIGGAPIARQVELLKEKPQIVIGGPARLLELIHLKKLKADSVETLVLDEADRLLSPELRESTEGLMERLPKKVQLIGNSATVSEYTRKTLVNSRITAGQDDKTAGELEFIALPRENVLKERITHWAIFAERRDKIDTLRSFINAEKPKKLIVFSSRTDQIENIVSKLKYRKLNAEGLSSKTDKQMRKAYIDRFRSGKLPILVTTDLASRGLDIPGITHVVQMDLMEGSDFFVHRAGRTARAGNTGINCVIGDAVEMQRYASLEKKLGIKVFPKVLYNGKIMRPEDLNDLYEKDDSE